MSCARSGGLRVAGGDVEVAVGPEGQPAAVVVAVLRDALEENRVAGQRVAVVGHPDDPVALGRGVHEVHVVVGGPPRGRRRRRAVLPRRWWSRRSAPCPPGSWLRPGSPSRPGSRPVRSPARSVRRASSRCPTGSSSRWRRWRSRTAPRRRPHTPSFEGRPCCRAGTCCRRVPGHHVQRVRLSQASPVSGRTCR